MKFLTWLIETIALEGMVLSVALLLILVILQVSNQNWAG
jgi:hypothetical protein